MEASKESVAAQEGAQSADKASQRARFVRIYQEALVERAAADDGASWSAMAIDALQKAQKGCAMPKYFSGEPPKPEDIASIDAIAGAPAETGGSTSSKVGGEPDRFALLLCGDVFRLCMALKPRPKAPATAQDPNFDDRLIDSFFCGVSQKASEESLEALGRLIDVVLEQGCHELGASPAKLRVVLVAFAHPELSNSTADECYQVLKKLLKLVGQLHSQEVARETLIAWHAELPLSFLSKAVAQIQQFLTVSILMAQAETGSASDSLEAVMEIARNGELFRHTRNSLRLLDIYWRANERRRERSCDWRYRRQVQLAARRGERLEEDSRRFLQPVCFHNDAVNEFEGLLKNDLKEVLETQHAGLDFRQMEDDKRHDFGVVEWPFVLTAVSKVRMLSIESLLMQREEVRSAMVGQILRGRLSINPFLVIKVRRDQVIQDALQQLGVMGSQQFKKPLKVVFDGEEGVDEGGVQKEFFQLLVEELYNEDFGMFERIEESRNFWFNKNSFEANVQFELFGIVLGLAIYNQVILDVKFPMAVYKKLLLGDSVQLGLSDLLDFQPSLAQGLIAMLEHDSASGAFEDIFGPLRFVVEYDSFGAKLEAELKEGGADLPVTWENREEYIEAYCKWIFTTSVSRQHGSFAKGFNQCIGDTLFRQLFRPEELELVICGSMELDFRCLQKSTNYQDGFSATTEAVKWLWEIIHDDLSYDEKKQFLQFCTGCDRAPVGGLGRLPFCVSRAGPDSDMLPSAHTCFNHVLLPEYSSKEKLERMLRLAIQHCTGFGLM